MTDGEIRASYRQAKYPKEQIKILAQLTDRPVAEIKRICGVGGGKRDVREERKKFGWTEEDIEFLRANPQLSHAEVERAIGKHRNAVYVMRNKLGLDYKVKKRNWTPEEAEFVIQGHLNGIKHTVLAGYIGKSRQSVSSYIYELKKKGKL